MSEAKCNFRTFLMSLEIGCCFVFKDFNPKENLDLYKTSSENQYTLFTTYYYGRVSNQTKQIPDVFQEERKELLCRNRESTDGRTTHSN